MGAPHPAPSHVPSFSATASTAGGKNLLLGIYRLSDPKISLASISAMFLGTCAAGAAGPISWPWLALVVIGILCLEAAKNASGDVFDYDSGADQAVADEDRSPFSGGKRVIVDGLLSRQQTVAVAAVFYLIGIVAGLVIVVLHEPSILAIGLAGVFLAWFYNAPPLQLSYRGLGEAAVALTYGPLICCGTYLALRHELPLAIIVLSLPLGILIAAFLVINEFPDRKADLYAGKRNLVVKLGERKAKQLFVRMCAVAFVLVLLLPLAGLPVTTWFGFAGLPFAIAAAGRLLEGGETARLIPAQRWTLLTFVLTALGLGFGLLA